MLARLYDPSEGRILLDGVDLREYDIHSVRRAIGVIFQDFVKYDFRFDENVAWTDRRGALVSRTRQAATDKRVARTAGRRNGEVPGAIVSASGESLASSLLPRFSKGTSRCSGGVSMRGRAVGGECRRSRRSGLHARALSADPGRADGLARCARRVRSLHSFSQLVAGRMAVIICIVFRL